MPLLIDALLVLSLVAALCMASPLFGAARRLEGDKGLPYETGMPPLSPQPGSMWVSYYRFAVLFVIFDVDLAFLVPWILLRRQLDLAMMGAMTGFLALIVFTLAYLWRRGGLRCR